MAFSSGEPSTIQATGEPQLIGQKDTTVVTFVGVPAAITQVAVIGIASADNPAINATIMLGMAVALKQLAPWAADWWAGAAQSIVDKALAAENKTAAVDTANAMIRVELTVNATLGMWMLGFERA